MIAIIAYLATLAFYIVVAVLAIPYIWIKAIVRGIIERSFKVYWSTMWEWCYNAAWGIDQAGSPLLSHLGNDLLIKPNSKHRIGSPDKTLSHYLGINKQQDTLYFLGLFWAYLVDIVALFFGDFNHINKAAKAEQFNK